LAEVRDIDARRLDIVVLAIGRGRRVAQRGLIPTQARTRLQRPHGLRMNAGLVHGRGCGCRGGVGIDRRGGRNSGGFMARSPQGRASPIRPGLAQPLPPNYDQLDLDDHSNHNPRQELVM
jgi:hypothetical protein